MAKMDFPETNRMHYGCSARELFLHPKKIFFFYLYNLMQNYMSAQIDLTSIAKQNHMFEGKTEATLVLVFLS
jgi:hypothetical protein